MAVIDPYRVVVIAIVFIMWTIIAFDHVFNPSSWTKIFFDLLTQALIVFRLLGRNFVSISIHALITIGILVTVYLHYFNDYGAWDFDGYTRYSLAQPYTNLWESWPSEISQNPRYAFRMIWLFYPIAILICSTLTGICCIVGLSLNVRKMFAAVHSVLGLCVTMIYFIVCIFYSYYFKNYDVLVAIKMLYYLLFLIVILMPDFVSTSQILSKYYVDEDEEEEEAEEEMAEVL